MRNNSGPGDLVYDPFLGSGTSIVAAEREGRVCIGLELDPVCCDTILSRWETETGRPAERLQAVPPLRAGGYDKPPGEGAKTPSSGPTLFASAMERPNAMPLRRAP